ncbi:RNA polymerase sigma factor [Psychroflexus sp. MES1-P1E]|uniref:RNA polymerase sigma factor n=1 Tax=Psychroflexus sp. MES1-P1E TaxID=2058320 RepID=UPI000C796BBB|nr:sigma-70 family RNA polymerase sigma factor [Psychroflexus sp. MES1-P1E]PKG42658.1 RNA polymerase subunit sigma-24 [Psychroflexus sp. MES1-P1E]
MTFEEIHKVYWSKVYRQCMGYMNDHDAAKDITQETFIKVWQHLPKFRNESSIGTWVFRIAVNSCLRQISKDKKMPKSEFPNEIVEEILVNNEPQVEFLYKCISELPEVERIIISLELEELKQKEIAKIVGLSESNVRVKIHRIKEKLSIKFQKHDK